MLEEYRKKRDFKKTPEPPAHKKTPGGDLRFVIQKHAARRLHYDFRLEVGGVLKSWAVPKGLPKAVSEKRLAIQTEDHPMEYATFEGVIPKGQYGGGRVEIWDSGLYANTKKGNWLASIEKDVQKGHVAIWLAGEKAKGGYSLVRMGTFRNTEKRMWLLLKMKDPDTKDKKTM